MTPLQIKRPIDDSNPTQKLVAALRGDLPEYRDMDALTILQLAEVEWLLETSRGHGHHLVEIERGLDERFPGLTRAQKALLHIGERMTFSTLHAHVYTQLLTMSGDDAAAFPEAERLLAELRWDDVPDVKPFAGVTLDQLVRTCMAAPAEWRARDVNGQDYYIRYRGGTFRVDQGGPGGPTLFQARCGDAFDGSMQEERMLALTGFEILEDAARG